MKPFRLTRFITLLFLSLVACPFTLGIQGKFGVKFEYCSIKGQPIVKLGYNATERGYQVIQLLDNDETRRLVSASHHFQIRSPTQGKSLHVLNRRADINDNNLDEDQHFVYARKCVCSSIPNFYCQVPWSDCRVPRHDPDGNGTTAPPPQCVNEEKGLNFVRTIWPGVWIAYVFLLIGLICTKPGRYVLDFCLQQVWSSWNDTVADRVLARDPDRAHRMMQRFWNRQGQTLEARYRRALRNQNGQAAIAVAVISPVDAQDLNLLPPTELALKTRIYKKEQNAETALSRNDIDDDFENGDEACPICFGPLQDGDRVGALPCEHVFHVDCLKLWLKQRNVCPLCQMPHVARPRYNPACVQVVHGQENNDNDQEDNNDDQEEGE